MKENEQFQGELFAEFTDSQGRLKHQKKISYQHHINADKTRFLFRSILSIFSESFLFLAIIFMMIAIVVFIVGVERGKKLAALTSKIPVTQSYRYPPFSVSKEKNMSLSLVEEEKKLKENYQNLDKTKSYTISEPKKDNNFLTSRKEEIKAEKKADAEKSPNNSDGTKLYTIQVATYREQALAQKEMQQLKKKGYSSFIIPSGKFYEVCTGSYFEKNKAYNCLKSLKKTYKDCFLRKK